MMSDEVADPVEAGVRDEDQGLAHQAAHAVAAYRAGDRAPLARLVGSVTPLLWRTVRAQGFNGYRHVGVLKDHVLKDGARHDLHIFEQSAAEWAQFRKKFRDDRNWRGEATVYRG